jgi:hypothetical protein
VDTGIIRTKIVQDGWLDPDDLYEVSCAEVEEMPTNDQLKEFRKKMTKPNQWVQKT